MGYTAPGTPTPVNVGGVFTITIAGNAVTNSDATLSVDGAGALEPAVCTYSSGTGSVQNGEDASITYQPGDDNSSSCPADSASLKLSQTSSGLTFIYSNADGFVDEGTCGIAGVPPSTDFTCDYTVKNDAGTGTGVSTISFNPPLNQKAAGNSHQATTFGNEDYSTSICPTLAFSGTATFPLSASQPNAGNWTVPIGSSQNCPTSPFGKVDFVTTDTTIKITAPGLSHPTGTPRIAAFEAILVDPNFLSFGEQRVNTTSPSKALTVTNRKCADPGQS
jgi:hypothetical protein